MSLPSVPIHSPRPLSAGKNGGFEIMELQSPIMYLMVSPPSHAAMCELDYMPIFYTGVYLREELNALIEFVDIHLLHTTMP